MKRWLPYPFGSLGLLGLWLLLNQSVAPGHVLLGAALGIAGGALLARLEPLHGRIRWRPIVVAELLVILLVDIVRSNLAVARIVLRLRAGGHRPGFLEVPLEMRHPAALALLACIVTATPGTSWARYDAAAGVVTIHMLDLAEGRIWAERFKARYERRLLEIFT